MTPLPFPCDSRGNTLHIGDRVRFLGETGVIDCFTPDGRIIFREMIGMPSTCQVDFVSRPPTTKE